MSNFLDKVNIPIAVEHSTPLDLSCDHLTTANFMQYNVAYAKELVPNEHISIDMTTFTRMEPLVAPTFGRCNVYNRAFFVPFRTLWGKNTWNNFITDTPVVSANGSKMLNSVPILSNSALVGFFESQECSSVVVSAVTSATSIHSYDYVDQSDKRGYKLTSFGRQAMKICESLGYKVFFSDGDETLYSALPLLSVVKIYLDWYYSNAYATDGVFAGLTQMFQKMDTWYLASEDLSDIFNCISRVAYDSDYFTACFDNPAGPNSGLYSAFQLPDVTNNSVAQMLISNSSGYTGSPTGGTLRPNNGTPFVGSNYTTGTYVAGGVLTQYTLDALKAMTDYMKRHQLVGGRAMDRYLARFGINLQTEKLDRSTYLGTDIVPVQIGDVTSNADTAADNGAFLGSYAGKGIAYGGSDFDFTADEFGMLVIISTIVPKIGYYQGQDKSTMRISKLDYYTPEYDGLGAEAVSARELYVPNNRLVGNYGDLNSTVFGWLPRYASYKVGRDRLTGDFVYDTMNIGEDSWHLMREFDTDEFPSSTSITHSRNFTVAGDAGQYSRIFNLNNSEIADKFRLIYHFDVKSQAPMSSLFDNYHFEESGKMVRENIGGVKMN